MGFLVDGVMIGVGVAFFYGTIGRSPELFLCFKVLLETRL